MSSLLSLQQLGKENVLTCKTQTPALIRAQKLNINVRPIKDFSLGSVIEILRLYRQIQPQAIIVYGGPEAFIIACLKFFKWIPHWVVCVRFRGSFEPRKGSKLAALKFPLILPCEALKPYYQPAEVIPLGIDTQRYQFVPGLRPKNSIDLLIFGRFDPVKGHREFLKVFQAVLQQGSITQNLRLHIVGKEANLTVEMIQNAVSQLGEGLEPHILVQTGDIKDVARLMSSVHLGVIPSIGSEWIGRVTQEFLACGTPVVVSGVGGLHELIQSSDGLSYLGQSFTQQVSTLKLAIDRFSHEPDSTRERRSKLASVRYSYNEMGKRLETILDMR